VRRLLKHNHSSSVLWLVSCIDTFVALQTDGKCFIHLQVRQACLLEIMYQNKMYITPCWSSHFSDALNDTSNYCARMHYEHTMVLYRQCTARGIDWNTCSDSTIAIATSTDMPLMLFDINTGANIRTAIHFKSDIFDLCYMPDDSNTVVCGARNGCVTLADTRANRCIQTRTLIGSLTIHIKHTTATNTIRTVVYVSLTCCLILVPCHVYVALALCNQHCYHICSKCS
jgi:WD40 repeat protein